MRLAFGSEQKIREQSLQIMNEGESLELSKDSKSINFLLNLKQLRSSDNKNNTKPKESFQEFSYRKFYELMDRDNMNEFIEDVQKTCWEITQELDTSVKGPAWNGCSFSASKKDGHSFSPSRAMRKEIELDMKGAQKLKSSVSRLSQSFNNSQNSPAKSYKSIQRLNLPE